MITPQGPSSSSFAFVVSNDPRIPDALSYKAGYVNPTPPAANFGSARLWGIAIADARAPGHESAQVEVAWTRLSCRVDGREIVLNEHGGQGVEHSTCASLGLARTRTIPCRLLMIRQIRRLCYASDCVRIGHFISGVHARALPLGRLDRCTVRARVRISAGAWLQVGMDDWCSPTIRTGWREQSRSWRQRLLCSLSGLAGSLVHRSWGRQF